jgi:Ca-activated chloride channel family protein
MVRQRINVVCATTGLVSLLCGEIVAQSAVSSSPTHAPLASCLIVPQARAWASHAAADRTVQIEKIDALVVILDQVATTTLDIVLKNTTSRPIESELLVPVPDRSIVRGFAFSGAAKEPTAKLLAKDQAARIYHSIVAKLKDPALLEFAGHSLVRSSVFPVPANGSLTVRLVYEHVLARDGQRIDYVLPRTESLDYRVPWTVSLSIKSPKTIATVYSPSHAITHERKSKNELAVKLGGPHGVEPGPVRLSYLVEQGDVTASLFAYPDPKLDGGYFLLLAGLPPDVARPDAGSGIKRDVTLVLDRSGSMAGEKFEQARQAARQIIGGLAPGEGFNVLAYDDTVEALFDRSVEKSPDTAAAAEAFLGRLVTGAGTNIHDALFEALRRKPRDGMLPIVLFLTDGLPTVGQTSEAAIRAVATKANPHHRRIFTFGVGFDVNTPLLERLAMDTRAAATFVLPRENVEVKVGGVFKRLAGPVLAEPKLTAIKADTPAATPRVSDLLPGKLPDVFEGDQLVLLGRYHGAAPLIFELAGNYRGTGRTFRFEFDLATATTKNAFVPRLWASRKIAVLVDAIRDLGADRPAAVAVSTASVGRPPAAADDPRLKELVESVVRLSTEFGVLTEYTAFLAEEGTDLGKRDSVLSQAAINFRTRAIDTRCGAASFNQSDNSAFMRSQTCLNSGNWYLDANLNRVSVSHVQQINDCTYYRRGSTWVDARLINRVATAKPVKTLEIGSDQLRELVERLVREGRPGVVSLKGDILLEVDGQPILIKEPAEAEKPSKP